MNSLRFHDLMTRLFHVLPEILPLYENRARELYAENNPDVVYGSIFVEYVRGLVDKLKKLDSEEVEDQVRRAFALVEELSTSCEFDTRCIAETSVLEGLLGDSNEDIQFLEHMGPETKRIARELLVKWSKKN